MIQYRKRKKALKVIETIRRLKNNQKGKELNLKVAYIIVEAITQKKMMMIAHHLRKKKENFKVKKLQKVEKPKLKSFNNQYIS
jgi:hypothetical protein